MSFKDWMKENLDILDLQDIELHGSSLGVPGLICTKDITALYDEYQEEIWEKITEWAIDCGYPNTIEYISTFYGAKSATCTNDFKKLLVYRVADYYASHLLREQKLMRKLQD